MKKRYWRPEGWDPIDHNLNVADEHAFRRSAMFHKAWLEQRDRGRRERRLKPWNRRRYWFGMRPLNPVRRR